MRRRRAILEDVAEMAGAGRAMNLGADHAVAAIDGCFNGTSDRIVEAGPTGPAFEFQSCLEQRLAAAGAGKPTRPFLRQQGATPWCLGAVRSHHVVLLRRQQAAPLSVGAREWIGFPRYVRLLFITYSMKHEMGTMQGDATMIELTAVALNREHDRDGGTSALLD